MSGETRVDREALRERRALAGFLLGFANSPGERTWDECTAGADAVLALLPAPHLHGEIARLRAEDAAERGEGICRTCLAPIWNEGGTIGRRERAEGWSDRIERGGDSLVCFKAADYRHVPLTDREACIYDRAYFRGIESAVKP